MKQNIEEILEGNTYFKILDRYAKIYERKGQLIEKRNRGWYTGYTIYKAGGSADELYVHFLFESPLKQIFKEEDGSYFETEGVIVRGNYLINPYQNIAEQVADCYESHFHKVMDSHFTNSKTD